jgi:hypothetical protein
MVQQLKQVVFACSKCNYGISCNDNRKCSILTRLHYKKCKKEGRTEKYGVVSDARKKEQMKSKLKTITKDAETGEIIKKGDL